MTLPVEVVFRNLAWRETADVLIRTKVEELSKFYNGLDACRVVIEVPHRHHRCGNRFRVRVTLAVRGGDDIVVDNGVTGVLGGPLRDTDGVTIQKKNEVAATQRDLSTAILSAFASARRRLQDFASLKRGAVKTHRARVA